MSPNDLRHVLDIPAPHFRQEVVTLPDGWLPRHVGLLLYNLARCVDGPILEIGSFVGRSTTCLAAGVRDSATRKQFITTDFHFESAEDFLAHYRRVHGPDASIPALQRHYMQDRGTMFHLQANLASRKLDDYVTVLRGDFANVLPATKFSLLYCDVTHDPSEVALNVPRLKEFVAEGAIVVFDDISSPELAASVVQHLPIGTCTLWNHRILLGRITASGSPAGLVPAKTKSRAGRGCHLQ